jgi:hypothetical protein
LPISEKGLSILLEALSWKRSLELIALKQQKEEIERLYKAKADETYNELTLAAQSIFVYIGE